MASHRRISRLIAFACLAAWAGIARAEGPQVLWEFPFAYDWRRGADSWEAGTSVRYFSGFSEQRPNPLALLCMPEIGLRRDTRGRTTIEACPLTTAGLVDFKYHLQYQHNWSQGLGAEVDGLLLSTVLFPELTTRGGKVVRAFEPFYEYVHFLGGRGDLQRFGLRVGFLFPGLEPRNPGSEGEPAPP